jgi:hypothetical protein
MRNGTMLVYAGTIGVQGKMLAKMQKLGELKSSDDGIGSNGNSGSSASAADPWR